MTPSPGIGIMLGMKRSSFKRPDYTPIRWPTVGTVAPPTPGVIERIEAPAAPDPKPATFRSATIREIAQHLPCSWPEEHPCGPRVWCHLNTQAHGKGMGHKASDAAGFAGCSWANFECDQGKRLTYEQKMAMSKEANRLSLIDMVEGGWLVPTRKPTGAPEA